MQRIFRKWNRSEDEEGEEDTLNLQDVVSGFAAVKGNKDIMANIQYFFELYDDDNDGRVDREGILRISEALLFLTRRGLDDGASPKASTSELALAADAEGRTDESILNSISAFIRRCFEYADPDHEMNKNQDVKESAGAVNDFSIGDEDDEENLLDVDDKPKAEPAPKKEEEASVPDEPLQSPKPDVKSANLALDPAHPLHITLPTFRMVILADENLEHFFDRAFANSFRLSDIPAATGANTLTTFANAGRTPTSASASPSLPSVPSTGGIVPPGKGLRGMLDNIVSDGMRVAAEVKRRMDEAQREMERANGGANGQGGSSANAADDDDDDDDGRHSGAFAETRSLHERDRDLLDGAETADVEEKAKVQGESSTGVPNLMDAEPGEGGGKGGEDLLTPARERAESGASGSRNVIEFDRGSTI